MWVRWGERARAEMHWLGSTTKLGSFDERYAYITHRSDHRLSVSHKDLSRKFSMVYHCRLHLEQHITIR
jgi:hypothetical protein